MAAPVEKVFADVADREFEFASGRHLYAILVFAHKHRIDHSPDVERFVDEAFRVPLLIVEFFKILFREGNQRAFVTVENLEPFENGEGVEPQRIECTALYGFVDNLLFIDILLEQAHHDLINFGRIAVDREVLGVGDESGEQACGGVAVEVGIESESGDKPEHELARR